MIRPAGWLPTERREKRGRKESEQEGRPIEREGRKVELTLDVELMEKESTIGSAMKSESEHEYRDTERAYKDVSTKSGKNRGEEVREGRKERKSMESSLGGSSGRVGSSGGSDGRRHLSRR